MYYRDYTQGVYQLPISLPQTYIHNIINIESVNFSNDLDDFTNSELLEGLQSAQCLLMAEYCKVLRHMQVQGGR